MLFLGRPSERRRSLPCSGMLLYRARLTIILNSIAEDYSLELIYKKPFHDIWREEKDDKDLRSLSERMGVRDREGKFALGDEEWEACG